MIGFIITLLLIFYLTEDLIDYLMIYKTIYGEFKNKYIESKEGVFWLTEPIVHKGFGFALLHKTYKGYECVRILKI